MMPGDAVHDNKMKELYSESAINTLFALRSDFITATGFNQKIDNESFIQLKVR